MDGLWRRVRVEEDSGLRRPLHMGRCAEEHPPPSTHLGTPAARDRHSRQPHLSHDRVRRIDPVLRLLARRDVDDLPGDPAL